MGERSYHATPAGARTSNLFYTLSDALLAERLCQITGYSKVFFGNSGAEANEGAIKLPRKYGREKRGEGCNQIITLQNSFHGRPITTLAATGQDSFHQHFFPFTEVFRYMPVNGQQQLSNAIDASVCGIMVELVQGEGGGLPIGAVLMDEQTENIFQPGHHGSTFGGNPVVCAGGIEALKQVYNEAFLSSVSAKADAGIFWMMRRMQWRSF